MSDTDLMALYSRELLALAAGIGHLGHLADPDGAAERRSPQCGSTVRVEVALSDGQVSGFAQQVRACALGQASAGLLARHMPGTAPGDLRAARDTLAAMLAGGPPPEGDWSDLGVLAAARDFPNRHASIMLAWEAALAAIDAAQAAQAAPEQATPE